MFNIIAEHIADSKVLDLFAGTGSLGIESLSRGANSAIFVDSSRVCQDIISQNLTNTKLADRGAVMQGEVASAIKRLSEDKEVFDIIFLDPPYNKNFIQETLNLIINNGIINKNSIIIAERDFADKIPEKVGCLKLVRNQKYGDTILSFYTCDNSE